jgi:2-keto-3-deoxy-L-rhamnonate aldolase RhmA
MEQQEQLEEVAKFCAHIPFGSRSVDYYSPKDWPTPWEILHHGLFCTSSISILMFYTIAMSTEYVDIDLILVQDVDGIFLLPIIGNRYILNYELGKVNMYPEIQGSVEILRRFSRNEIKVIT